MAKIGEISDNPNLNLAPYSTQKSEKEKAFRTFAEGCFAVDRRGIEAKIPHHRRGLQRIAPTKVEFEMDPESPLKNKLPVKICKKEN